MTFNPTEFDILNGLLTWLLTFGGFIAVVLVVAVLTLLAGKGMRGPRLVVQQLLDGLRDTLSLSLRRVWALALLTIKESVRRKALLVFVLFALLFMFAGWFMPTTDIRPDLSVKNHVSLVLQRAIPWLILPLALLLACWGLPEDIKARSLHTVVTKPARRNEIVIGRILGFACVGTFLLLVMAVVGYYWIIRQVPASARSSLICRVPIYGEITYLTRDGTPGDPVNVGYIWEHRGYIEGATKSRGVWDFERVTPAAMVGADEQSQQLHLESRFEAFRTHKGEMDRALLCQLSLINPESGLPPITLPAFEVNEFGYNLTPVQRKLSYYDESTGAPQEVDLFDDLVRDGKLRVTAQCLDPGQYLGMARPDLFIRTPDKRFIVGYSKAIFGIWLMMVLIIALGVAASCFLKGPVATLLTGTFIVVGQSFREFLDKFVSGEVQGGGAIEQSIRIVEHMNVFESLQESWTTRVIKFVDTHVIQNLLWLVHQIIPDFSSFRTAAFVANGFDVSWGAALLPCVAITLGYVFPCLLIGYYSLKLRELEAK